MGPPLDLPDAGSPDVNVTIDDGGRLRVLRPEAREQSTTLVEECEQLVSKVRELQKVMAYIHGKMNKSSEDARRREEEEVLSKIQAKEKETEDFAAYLKSLERAEKEQRAEIAKLEGR